MKNKTIIFRLTKDLNNYIEKRCKDENITKSYFLNRLLKNSEKNFNRKRGIK